MEPQVHYRIHKCPSPVPILSQLDPVHTPTPQFLNIHLNIILQSTSGSPKWFLSFRFPNQNPVYASPLPHTRYKPRPIIHYPSSGGAVGGHAARTGQMRSAFLLGRASCVHFFCMCAFPSVRESLQLCPTVRYTLLTATGRSGGPTPPSTSLIKGLNQTDMWSEWQINNFARHCTEQILQ